jgi:hypothetical protein
LVGGLAERQIRLYDRIEGLLISNMLYILFDLDRRVDVRAFLVIRWNW